jgi:hypothetical protein
LDPRPGSKITQAVEPLSKKLGFAKLDHRTTVAQWLHIVNVMFAASPAQHIAHRPPPICLDEVLNRMTMQVFVRDDDTMIAASVQCRYYLYSKISPGWHSKALQTASSVDSRIAFTLPFFNTEILAIVMPTFSASSVTLIFRFANMTSMLMMIAILVSLHR